MYINILDSNKIEERKKNRLRSARLNSSPSGVRSDLKVDSIISIPFNSRRMSGALWGFASNATDARSYIDVRSSTNALI